MRSEYLWPLTNSKQVILPLSEAKLRKNVIFFDISAFSNFALYCIVQLRMSVNYLCNSTAKLFFHNSLFNFLLYPPSQRMPRHIRVPFTRAGAKIQNWLEKSARDNKEYGQQAATSACVFLFHGHINSPGQVPAYGICRGGINKWFWTQICFIKSRQVLSNLLWKSTILGALWYGHCSLSGIFRPADRLSLWPAYGKVSTGCRESSCKFSLVYDTYKYYRNAVFWTHSSTLCKFAFRRLFGRMIDWFWNFRE